MKPKYKYAHKSGFFLSIPTALSFVLFFLANQSNDPNPIIVLPLIITCFAALPWSFISLILFLNIVGPGHSSSAEILAYCAPFITIFGAHFNGFMFGLLKFNNMKTRKSKDDIPPEPENEKKG